MFSVFVDDFLLVFNDFLETEFHRYGIPKLRFVEKHGFKLVISEKTDYQEYYALETEFQEKWELVHTDDTYVAIRLKILVNE